MTYTAFTIDQIRAALPKPERWVIDPSQPGREIVYRCDFEAKYGKWALVCFSGVTQGEIVSRKRGSDAIRFCLLDTVTGKPVGKATRVHRSGTPESLQERMRERSRELALLAQQEEPLRCARCGASTVERKNNATGQLFRGCRRWNECKAGTQVTERQAAVVMSRPMGDR